MISARKRAEPTTKSEGAPLCTLSQEDESPFRTTPWLRSNSEFCHYWKIYWTGLIICSLFTWYLTSCRIQGKFYLVQEFNLLWSLQLRVSEECQSLRWVKHVTSFSPRFKRLHWCTDFPSEHTRGKDGKIVVVSLSSLLWLQSLTAPVMPHLRTFSLFISGVTCINS